MKTPDDQMESSRRLEEYRIRCEQVPEPKELGEFQEMNTISKWQEKFFRKPAKPRRFGSTIAKSRQRPRTR